MLEDAPKVFSERIMALSFLKLRKKKLDAYCINGHTELLTWFRSGVMKSLLQLVKIVSNRQKVY